MVFRAGPASFACVGCIYARERSRFSLQATMKSSREMMATHNVSKASRFAQLCKRSVPLCPGTYRCVGGSACWYGRRGRVARVGRQKSEVRRQKDGQSRILITLDRYADRNENFVLVVARLQGYQGRSPWLVRERVACNAWYLW